MNAQNIGTGNRKILKIAGLRVQSGNLVHWSVIGYPHVSLFVGSRTPGKLPANFILDVNNPHSIVAERLHHLLVSRNIRWRFRKRRIFSKHPIQIRRDIAGFLVVDPHPHGGPHVFDAISPARLVANRGSDSGLNSVASSASSGGLPWLRGEKRSLAFSRGQELIRLIERNVGP